VLVRTLADLEAAGRVLDLASGTRSARYVVAADRLGYSYNDNRGMAGNDITLWYKNHWEANFIIEGRGEVADLTTGQAWTLEPGVMYIVGPNDRHRLRLSQDSHFLSIFCPPLRGDERHDPEGGYPAAEPAAPTDRRMFVKRGDEMRAAGLEKSWPARKAATLRMLTKADDLGFGFSDVYFGAGASPIYWYKHHWEANHIVAGEGEVEDLTTGEKWPLGPGSAYYVGPKDRHQLRCHTDVHLLSIFSPPLRGDEQHDADGALEPSGPVPPGPEGY